MSRQRRVLAATARGAVVAVALLGLGLTAAPGQAAQSPDGAGRLGFDAVYVVNGGDGMSGSITVINADTNRVVRTIALPNAMWPHHVYLSPDGRRLAVAAPGMDFSMGHGGPMPPDMKGEVITLDARTGAILNRMMMPAMNHNAIFSADGREIWTSQMMMDMPGSVLVLDSRTLKTKAEIPVGEMPAEVTLAPDGRFFYVASMGSDSVTVIDARTRRVVRTVPVGDGPIGAWQASNGFAYVDNEEGMTVSALDRRSLAVRSTFKLGFMPGMARLRPDGHLWVTDSDAGRVVLFSLDTVARHAIMAGEGAHAIAFSADGRTAYVTNQMANTVSVIDVRTRTVKRTLTVGMKPNGLAFRPAG